MIVISSRQDDMYIINPAAFCSVRRKWTYFLWSPEDFVVRYIPFSTYTGLDCPDYLSVLSAVQKETGSLKGRMEFLELKGRDGRCLIRCETEGDAKRLFTRIKEAICASDETTELTVIELSDWNAAFLPEEEARDVEPLLCNQS